VALGDAYITKDELKTFLGIELTDTQDDTRLDFARVTASRGIDSVCRRQFNLASTATARLFYPDRSDLTEIHDFYTTTGLVIETDPSGDGSGWTTWASTSYQLEPLNGTVDGVEGYPWWRIRAVASNAFSFTRAANVRVTARWGWAAVPGPVRSAAFTVAEEIYKLREAPFGVAGFGQWGQIRVRENPLAMGWLAPYRRKVVLVA
jgi:hypothetical protein